MVLMSRSGLLGLEKWLYLVGMQEVQGWVVSADTPQPQQPCRAQALREP